MSSRDRKHQGSNENTPLVNRWAQMTKQEQLIEKKKQEIQAKFEAQKQAAALAKAQGKEAPDPKKASGAKNVFNNDGSFMKNFHQLLQAQKKDKIEKEKPKEEEKPKEKPADKSLVQIANVPKKQESNREQQNSSKKGRNKSRSSRWSEHQEHDNSHFDLEFHNQDNGRFQDDILDFQSQNREQPRWDLEEPPPDMPPFDMQMPPNCPPDFPMFGPGPFGPNGPPGLDMCPNRYPPGPPPSLMDIPVAPPGHHQMPPHMFLGPPNMQFGPPLPPLPPDMTPGPNSASGPPNMHQGPPNMHERPPNMHQAPPNMHQEPPNMHQRPQNMHQRPPDMPPGLPHMQQRPPNMPPGPPPNMSQGTPNMPQGPPNMPQGPPNMPPGPPPNMSQGPPNMLQGPPNMPLGPPNMSQGPPNMPQGPPNMLQGPPNMPQGPPNMFQGLPNMPQGPPNMPQGPPNMPQGPPNMSQGPPNMPPGSQNTSSEPSNMLSGMPHMPPMPPNLPRGQPNEPSDPNSSFNMPNKPTKALPSLLDMPPLPPIPPNGNLRGKNSNNFPQNVPTSMPNLPLGPPPGFPDSIKPEPHSDSDYRTRGNDSKKIKQEDQPNWMKFELDDKNFNFKKDTDDRSRNCSNNFGRNSQRFDSNPDVDDRMPKLFSNDNKNTFDMNLLPPPFPPNTNDVLSTDGGVHPAVERAAREVSLNGPHWEIILRNLSAQEPTLWFLQNPQSKEYDLYRQLVMKYVNEDQMKQNVKPEDKYEPEFSLEDEDSDSDRRPNKRERDHEQQRQEDREQRRKRKKKSRWGDEAEKVELPTEPAVVNVPQLTMPQLPLPQLGVLPPTVQPQQMRLTSVNRNNPALMQYAMMNYGSTNLAPDEWKQCEDNFKLNLLYQEMMNKRKEIERLAAAGKNKYEYDSDEDTEQGTWEHKLRSKEMNATEEWATELTKQAAGKHHIGDFLPPEELKKFMEQYSSLKTGKEPDLSDYKEYKLNEENKGFKMLQKLGWNEGTGLGADGSGIVVPINKAVNRDPTAGLGAIVPGNVSADDDEFDAYRKRMMLAYRFRPNPLNNPRRPYY